MNRHAVLLIVLALNGSLRLDADETKSAASVQRALGLRHDRALFDGKTLDGWIQIPAGSWTVKDGAMASTGNGRGVIYTKDDFSHYRLIFTMRHVSGNKDHQACFLIFGTRPPEGQKGLDSRWGGIQFQAAQRRPLGLSQRPQQRRQSRVPFTFPSKIRSSPVEPGGNRG